MSAMIPSNMGSPFARSLVAVLLLASLLRTVDIASESLWVDEAFSENASRGSISHILEMNARDTHPPLHSLVLAFWRSVFEPEVADPTEVAVVLRANSVLWSLLSIALAMQLAREIAGARVAQITGLFLALSPIDIYFANEVRSYIQLTALGLFGAWSMWRWCEAARHEADWRVMGKWAAVFALAGEAMIYTHYVGITLLVAQGLVGLSVFVARRRWVAVAGLAAAALIVAALFAPWIVYVFDFRDSLARTASIDWMPVPGFADFVSMIGREYFWGRVHRIHGEWGGLTAVVPVTIIVAALWRARDAWPRRVPPGVGNLLGYFALPLVLCAAVSYADQVIYYRPRYSVLLVPYFSIALAWACARLGTNARVVTAVVTCAALLTAGFAAQLSTPQKRPWRETALDWPEGDAPAFYVVLPSEHQGPLRHYLGDRIRHTPKHVLERLSPLPEGALIWVANWPEALAGHDAVYRDWLEQVGDARRQVLDTYYTLTQVEPRGGAVWPAFARERFASWYRPFDIRGEVAGFSEATRFGPIRFDDEGSASRSAEGPGLLRFDRVASAQTFVMRASLAASGHAPGLRLLRARDPSRLLRDGAPAAYDPVAEEFRGVVPEGQGPLWVGWAPRTEGAGGLRLRWVGFEQPKAPGMAFHD